MVFHLLPLKTLYNAYLHAFVNWSWVTGNLPFPRSCDRSRVAIAAGPTKFSTALSACAFDMVPVLFMSYMLNMVDKSSSLKRQPTKFVEAMVTSASCSTELADCIWRRMSTRKLFTSLGLWYISDAVNICCKSKNKTRSDYAKAKQGG